MTQRLQISSTQLRAAKEAAEADNRYVGPRVDEAIRELEGTATALALDVRDRHMERTRTVGSEVTQEFSDLVGLGQTLAERVVHGEIGPEDARRELDHLFARFEMANRRVEVFEAAATSAEEIEADPLGFAERLYEAHPTIRPEVEI